MLEIDYYAVYSSFMTIYANTFAYITLDSVLAQMQLIMIIKTLYMIVSALLPIEGLVNTLFSPFSTLHQAFHVHAAKALNNKYRDENGRRAQHVRINVSLGDSSIRKREYTNLSFIMNNQSALTIRDVMYFANASSAVSFVLILAMVSVGPLMQDIFFATLHLYIMLGIVLCLMPSKTDTKMIINFMLTRTEISPWYVVNIIIAFFLSAGVTSYPYIYAQYYPSYWGLEAVLNGIWGAMCYLFMFAFLVLVTEERKLFPQARRTYYEERDERMFGQDTDRYTFSPEEQAILDELDSTL